MRGNWDVHSHDYKISQNNTTNVTVDKIKFNDFTLGDGYRFGENKLKLTSLLKAGFTLLSFNKIEEMFDNYKIVVKSIDKKTLKFSSGLEYSFNPNFALTFESSYLMVLDQSIFYNNNNFGFLSFGLGLTTSFY